VTVTHVQHICNYSITIATVPCIAWRVCSPLQISSSAASPQAVSLSRPPPGRWPAWPAGLMHQARKISHQTSTSATRPASIGRKNSALSRHARISPI